MSVEWGGVESMKCIRVGLNIRPFRLTMEQFRLSDALSKA